MDRLKSESDIFCYHEDCYKTPEQFRYMMSHTFKTICCNLLFDPWEFAFWLHIVNLDELDILRMRQKTGLNDYLKYDHLLMYVGLNLKMHFKYHQELLHLRPGAGNDLAYVDQMMANCSNRQYGNAFDLVCKCIGEIMSKQISNNGAVHKMYARLNN